MSAGIDSPVAAPAPSRRSARLQLVAGLAVVACAAVVLYSRDPAGSGAGFYPRCPLYQVTGLYCPGCGTTRGLHHLLHGRVAAAFAYNPLMVLSIPFLAYAITRQVLTASFGFRPAGRLPAGWIWAIAALFTAYWVLRNVPVRPFVYLAPHAT